MEAVNGSLLFKLGLLPVSMQSLTQEQAAVSLAYGKDFIIYKTTYRFKQILYKKIIKGQLKAEGL